VEGIKPLGGGVESGLLHMGVVLSGKLQGAPAYAFVHLEGRGIKQFREPRRGLNSFSEDPLFKEKRASRNAIRSTREREGDMKRGVGE